MMKTYQRAADWLRTDVMVVMGLAKQGKYVLINRAAMYTKAEEDSVGIAEQWKP